LVLAHLVLALAGGRAEALTSLRAALTEVQRMRSMSE
jgi:hypothetical protein